MLIPCFWVRVEAIDLEEEEEETSLGHPLDLRPHGLLARGLRNLSRLFPEVHFLQSLQLFGNGL